MNNTTKKSLNQTSLGLGFRKSSDVILIKSIDNKLRSC